MPENKLKFAFYWAASCGGCDVAVLDTKEKILEIAELAEIVLWPVAMDHKYESVKSLADGEVDVCFFNGGVRNSEQFEMAHLLREKSKTLVAFGSCAHLGGIPALANLFGRDEIFKRVYEETPSTDNPNGTIPLEEIEVPEGRLTLPRFYNSVYKLDDVVRVDYYLPGCPPPADNIYDAVKAIVAGDLPEPGSVLAPDRTLCSSCPREREDKRVVAFKRVHLTEIDPTKCLLDQGILCCGPVTRDGCGARCIQANMPCRGCFGPTSKVTDQGAKLLGAVATLVDSNDEAEIERVLSGVVDPVGTFCRFSMSATLLRIKRDIARGDGRAGQGVSK